jgi:hypothetical protein
VKKFVKEMITAHPGGWSVFGERCYCHRDGKRTREPRMVFTHENFARGEDGSAEWLWVFDPENNKLFVRDLNHKEDVAAIDLSGSEPDWSMIECGEHFERCCHYAW